jgi:hypothetical protein
VWLDGAIFDITERRRAEDAVREHETERARLARASSRPPTPPLASNGNGTPGPRCTSTTDPSRD